MEVIYNVQDLPASFQLQVWTNQVMSNGCLFLCLPGVLMSIFSPYQILYLSCPSTCSIHPFLFSNFLHIFFFCSFRWTSACSGRMGQAGEKCLPVFWTKAIWEPVIWEPVIWEPVIWQTLWKKKNCLVNKCLTLVKKCQTLVNTVPSWVKNAHYQFFVCLSVAEQVPVNICLDDNNLLKSFRRTSAWL